MGIAFDDIDDPKDLPLLPKIAGKLTGGLSNKAFEADVWVEWNRANPRGGITQWTQQRISPSQAGGLFGKWGLHETLSTAWGADGSLFKAAGFANPEDFNPAKLLENTATAQGFLENLKLGAQDFINTGTESSPYAKIARMMGLTDFEADPLTGFPIINAATGLPQFKGLEAFEQQLAKLNAAGGGFSLLEMLGDPNQTKGTFPLEAGARWDFLSRIFKEKKVAQLISDNGTAIKFIGLLNKYNRVANAAYIFFYRELLGGGYAGSNVIFKTISTLLKPIRGLGFADETLISEAVAKWGIVKWFKGLSTKLFTMSDNPALAGSRNIFVKMLGSVGLKSLGFLAQGTAGSLTGGLAYLISAVGQMGVSFFKSILWDNKGRLDMALKAAAGVITSKIRTLSKLLVGIVLLGCSCFMVPIFFVMVIVAMMAPMEPATGGGAYADVVLSKKVQVEKTAVQSGTDITYRISITNITNTSTDPEIPPQDITITSFTDRLSYARSCSAGGGIVDVTSDPSLGSVSIPAIGSLPKTTLIPGETIEVGPFTLSNINPADGTYLNTVEVLIEGDDKKGEASVSTSIGAGGCAVCPAGWPTQPFVLTQGAQTSSSHRNAEALDLASGIGQSVKATHNGKAYTFDNKCDDDDHSKECGYGNYIEIVSPMGFSTIYAHLVGFQIGNNQEVAANEIIGYLGTSGNSTGPHLHYEFKNTSVQCIPNRPLRMQYYNEPTFPGSYIPENIPNPNCVDDVNCNMSR